MPLIDERERAGPVILGVRGFVTACRTGAPDLAPGVPTDMPRVESDLASVAVLGEIVAELPAWAVLVEARGT